MPDILFRKSFTALCVHVHSFFVQSVSVLIRTKNLIFKASLILLSACIKLQLLKSDIIRHHHDYDCYWIPAALWKN